MCLPVRVLSLTTRPAGRGRRLAADSGPGVAGLGPLAPAPAPGPVRDRHIDLARVIRVIVPPAAAATGGDHGRRRLAAFDGLSVAGPVYTYQTRRPTDRRRVARPGHTPD